MFHDHFGVTVPVLLAAVPWPGGAGIGLLFARLFYARQQGILYKFDPTDLDYIF